MARKLNQVLAIEAASKDKLMKQYDALCTECKRPASFEGHAKTFIPVAEDQLEKFPPENLKVQQNVNDILARVKFILSDVYDTIATKDYGNTMARADVVIDNDLLLSGVPAPTLLFFEKQLTTQLYPFLASLPELSEDKKWEMDPNDKLHKSEVVTTQRTKKKQMALVLVAPTDKHPGQAQMITEDVVIGNWDTVFTSGAIPRVKKLELLDRLDRLKRAITEAREKANLQEVEQQQFGQQVIKYLLA